MYYNIQDYVKQLMRKHDFTIYNADTDVAIKALIEAFKIVMPRLIDHNIGLTFRLTDYREPYYRILNQNTINFLNDYIVNHNRFDIKDSTNDFVFASNEIERIEVEFKKKKLGKRINPGFFPFINTTDIDLRKYGIFNNINCEGINESCLIQSFAASGILSDDELLMMKTFVKTRTVPQTVLNDIASFFKIYINCKILYENGNESHANFGMEFKETRSIKLIMNSHYLLNDRTNVSEFYIKKYNDIHKDSRFINHPRRFMLLKYDDKRYNFSKRGMKITKLINIMIEN